MNNPEPSNKIEKALEIVYSAPKLSDVFINSLERQLRESAQEKIERYNESIHRRNFWERLFYPGLRFSGGWVAIFSLMVLGLSVLAIGPQRVLAQIQSLFKFVPEVGFYDPKTTRVLANPVSQTKMDITLRVSVFTVTTERTIVILDSEGFPAEAFNQIENGDAFKKSPSEFAAHLLFPDGTYQSYVEGIDFVDWPNGKGKIVLSFRPVPQDIDHLTLYVTSIYNAPTELIPKEWQFNLSLKPATEKAEIEDQSLIYDLSNVMTSKHGVTLRILSVALHADQTAVRVHLQWPEKSWVFEEGSTFLNAGSVTLSDDIGNVYDPINDPSGMWASDAKTFPQNAELSDKEVEFNARAIEQSLSFVPIKTEVRQLTLDVSDIELYAPPAALGELGFEIDLGAKPQIGDQWPLDIQLDIAGFPVHITSARIVDDAPGPFWGPGLALSTDPVLTNSGYSLAGYHLTALDAGYTGIKYGPNSYGGFETVLYVDEGKLIPSGPTHILVDGAAIRISGPWELTMINPFYNNK